MNANPFTNGHRFLVEYAANHCKWLYVFVVEEDKSFFKFKDRLNLVKKGVSDIDNVFVLASGRFILSSLTFEDYFNKANLQENNVDPSLDIEIFASEICPVLGITARFVGEEPLDNVTKQYNETMKRILPRYGVELCEIPRKESNNIEISASRVRALLEQGDFKEIQPLVPSTTYDFLYEHFA